MKKKIKLSKKRTSKKVAQPPARARGRRPSADPRKPSHIPLNTSERERLHAAAEAMGLPYATWARGTLLIVADWPATAQPIRLGGAVRGGGALEALTKQHAEEMKGVLTRLSVALSAPGENKEEES